MLTKIEENYLRPLLTLYGARGLVEVLATMAERTADRHTGALQAIAEHDARVLRATVPQLWDAGNDRRGIDR